MKDSGAGTQLAAALLGGALVAGTHLTKAGTRALINTSPEPFSNWGASAGEDVGWFGAMYLMWRHPLVLLVLLGLFVLLMCRMLPRIVRGLRTLRQRLRLTLSGDAQPR